MLTFIDNYSMYTMTYLIKEKKLMLEKSEAFVAIVCNRFQRKPLTVCTDNGGGCVGYEMKNYLTEEGMHNQLTVLYTSKQNGVAEKEKSISH